MAHTPISAGAGRLLLLAAGLALLIVAAWASSVPGGPVFDDHFLVVGQNCFKSLSGLARILLFEPGYACTYRPARYVSYGVDHLLFGDNFWAYHVGNIVHHELSTLAVGALASLLFARVDRRRSASQACALGLAVAAVWALHPVQTDSVSYVSGRRDILAGGWTFAAVALSLVAARRGGLWWVAVLWATLVAFMSKESAVVIPVLGLLVASLTGEKPAGGLIAWIRRHPATVVAGAVGVGLSLLLVLYRGVLDSHSDRGFAWWGGSVTSNFATVAALQVRYLQLVVLAAPLIGDYRPDTIPLAAGFGDPRALLGLTLCGALAAAAFLARRRRPLVTAGVGWYLISLAPVSHVFPHHELFAEHYLYIPLFGLALAAVDLVAWGLEVAPDPARWRRIAAAALGALLVTFVVSILDRNRDFANERAFYEHVVELAPNNLRAVANLGNIAFDQGDFDVALEHLGTLAPLWTAGSQDELRNVGRALEAAERVGDRDRALALARQLAEHHPDVGAGHRHLAQLSLEAGDPPTALASAMRWWRVARDPAALSLAGRAAVGRLPTGLPDAAHVDALATAVEAEPSAPRDATYHAAIALHALGRSDRAYALLASRRPTPSEAQWDAASCAIGRAAGVSAPVGCPPVPPSTAASTAADPSPATPEEPDGDR